MQAAGCVLITASPVEAVNTYYTCTPACSTLNPMFCMILLAKVKHPVKSSQVKSSQASCQSSQVNSSQVKSIRAFDMLELT